MPPIAVPFGSLVTHTLHRADALQEAMSVSMEKNMLADYQGRKQDDINARKTAEEEMIATKFEGKENDNAAMQKMLAEQKALDNKYDNINRKLLNEVNSKEKMLDARQHQAEVKEKTATANMESANKSTQDSAGKAGIKWT